MKISNPKELMKFFISVNDPFVMQKWGESVGKNEFEIIADSNGDFMKSSELMVDLSRNCQGNRLSRFSMLVDDGMVKEMFDENGLV